MRQDPTSCLARALCVCHLLYQKVPGPTWSILTVDLRFTTSGTHHSQDAAHEGITQTVDLEG